MFHHTYNVKVVVSLLPLVTRSELKQVYQLLVIVALATSCLLATSLPLACQAWTASSSRLVSCLLSSFPGSSLYSKEISPFLSLFLSSENCENTKINRTFGATNSSQRHRDVKTCGILYFFDFIVSPPPPYSLF